MSTLTTYRPPHVSAAYYPRTAHAPVGTTLTIVIRFTLTLRTIHACVGHTLRNYRKILIPMGVMYR